MKELIGNVFDQIGKCNAIAIPTNGFVKSNGEGVMGRGVAYQFAKKYPNLPSLLGDSIKFEGFGVNYLTNDEGTEFWAFPTKPDYVVANGSNLLDRFDSEVGNRYPGWMAKSDISIIKSSIAEMLRVTNHFNWEKVIIPWPGCGNGELTKDQVRPLVEHLDDRFTFISL